MRTIKLAAKFVFGHFLPGFFLASVTFALVGFAFVDFCFCGFFVSFATVDFAACFPPLRACAAAVVISQLNSDVYWLKKLRNNISIRMTCRNLTVIFAYMIA